MNSIFLCHVSWVDTSPLLDGAFCCKIPLGKPLPLPLTHSTAGGRFPLAEHVMVGPGAP